jgi:hypothetical protein
VNASKNCSMVCQAIVLPNADDILHGALPLEAMDLSVNPLEPMDTAVFKLKSTAHKSEIFHFSLTFRFFCAIL